MRSGGALAILTALRAWAPRFTRRTPLGIRSGNQDVLVSLVSRAASSPELSLVFQDISPDK
eukprot:11121187-Alexandrium_andersonii.AAC.1